MKRFFDKDPEILWTKVLCPICGEPTGPYSRCFEIDPAEQKTVVSAKGKNKDKVIPLGLYNENCHFRTNNLWVLELNYPISEPIRHILDSTDGVENIMPLKAYAVQISIGSLFDEKIVKNDINQRINTLIKSCQAREGSNLCGDDKKNVSVEVSYGDTKITLNNLDQSSQSLLDNVVSELPIQAKSVS